MTASVNMRMRIIALGGLLAALVLGAATMTLSRGSDENEAPATAVRAAADPAAPAAGTTRSPAATPAPSAKAVTPPPPPPARPDSGLPVRVANALLIHEVIVVSLVSPSSPLDKLAAAEASAGAKRAGVGFVKIEVADRQAMKRLTAELQVRHTPSVLVFTRPDRLFIQVKGFADRETVAQAATNAS
jgi:hypothetical protein